MIKQLTGKFYVMVAVLSLFFASCSNDDPNPEQRAGEKGFFIVNEGAFTKGNTSLSFYDRSTKAITNNVFADANGGALGDQSQSMTIHEGKGYVVVQNSKKIEVINIDTYKRIATIKDDIVSPRYFVGLSATKGYVSDWGAKGIAGTVKVIDLATNKVTKTIATGQGANQMLLAGTKLYVVNEGGWGRDNTVKIIDTTKDEVESTITIAGTDNPKYIQRDSDGNIWVATKGYTKYEGGKVNAEKSTPGAIIKFSSAGKIIRSFGFQGVGGGPGHLSINRAGNKLYYTYKSAVYELSTSATALPTKKFIDKKFYGISVDPFDDSIIGCVAPNFSSSGSIEIYDTAGKLVLTRDVGIAPNGCAFK